MARRDLGSILVDEKVISPSDLERVEGERAGRPLWAALLASQLTSEEEIFFLLAKSAGAQVISDEHLETIEVPPELKRAMTREEAMAVGLLPIDFSTEEQRATVVMVDPSDEQTLAAFLGRARLSEGKPLLGHRSALERAIERCYQRGTAAGTTPSAQAGSRVVQPRKSEKTEVAQSVQLDPQLKAEMERLPAQALEADPLTPIPQRPPGRSSAARTGQSSPAARSRVATHTAARSDEALRSAERLNRALLEVVEAVSGALDHQLGLEGRSAEMARLARRVARKMGLGRRAADEIGVAAQLLALDRALAGARLEGAPELFAELGWPAAGEGGLIATLRALTAASAGFGAKDPDAPIGARVIGAVSDYLELGAASGEPPDLGTVSQLLRTSSAGAQVVDALLRVLDAENRASAGAVEVGAGATVVQAMPATSLFDDQAAQASASDQTPDPAEHETTQRKAVPARSTRKSDPGEGARKKE
jgi:hypothetical protein